MERASWMISVPPMESQAFLQVKEEEESVPESTRDFKVLRCWL